MQLTFDVANKQDLLMIKRFNKIQKSTWSYVRELDIVNLFIFVYMHIMKT